MDKNKIYTIAGIILGIAVIVFLYKKIAALFMQPTTIAPPPPKDINTQTGTQVSGGSATGGAPVTVANSDQKLQDIAQRLKDKIQGWTWWGWDEDSLKETLSLSDYDLARLSIFYTQKTNSDLATDLENEQTGLFSPTGANARKIIERLRNLKK